MFPHKFISGSQLKWLAIITMFFDHTAKIISFQPNTIATVPYGAAEHSFENIQALFSIFITIGRIAFPIFCFLLVEGFVHTSNRKKYVYRLFSFAICSQIPYSLAFSQQLLNWKELNVFFTLLIGLLVIIGLEEIPLTNVRSAFYNILLVGTGVCLAEWLQTDYGGKIGVLLIIVFYIFRKKPLYQILLGSLVILQNSLFGIFSIFLLLFYNGERGKQWKYFFYLFYPLHLLLLIAIQRLIIIPYFQ